jgi:hypothetical protein
MYTSFSRDGATDGTAYHSRCLTLLRVTAYSFGEEIFVPCADRIAVAQLNRRSVTPELPE